MGENDGGQHFPGLRDAAHSGRSTRRYTRHSLIIHEGRESELTLTPTPQRVAPLTQPGRVAVAHQGNISKAGCERSSSGSWVR
jgi:hypothetical protein